MVLRVCLATLADPTDVDDAFQAVFAILFRQGAAIRSRDSVASWLHGVALRVSARANVDAARRRKHERKAGRALITATVPADDADRAATALHEEVARLPDRYREAVVLEGHAPTARAFALIGITEGIVARKPGTPAQGPSRP